MVRIRSSSLIVAVVLVLAACSPAPEPDATAVTVPAITEAWIPMEDGMRLAADIYWPEGATESDQYPVLLEYTPYRKDESRARNQETVPRMAGACPAPRSGAAGKSKSDDGGRKSSQ